MTEFELKHGLSQDEPGPLEPVEIAQQDDTLARTGNTARDQEMYAAGIRTGEENTKHNAAIRAGVPEGWKLLAKKTCYVLMHDGAVIATLAGPESEANAAIIARMLAAPGVSTVEDAQDERQADACPRCEGSGEITVMSDNSPDAHDVVVCCDHCQGSGAAVDAAKYLAAALAGEKFRHMQLWGEYRNFHRSLCARFGYGHDEVHFRRDLVSREEAIAAKVASPAAGDAPAESAPEWATCESRGPWARNSLKAAIDLLREKETRARHAFTKDYMGLPARYIADAYGEAAAVVERKLGAIAAQRKGDA